MYSTRASRWVRASPAEVYRALLDPYAVIAWRVPNDMTGTVHEFEAREGGEYRISMRYVVPGLGGASAERTDTYQGRFISLEDDRRVVESIEFASSDPAYAGTLTFTTELRAIDDGCEVVMAQDGVPDAVDRATSEVAVQMVLVRLAAWVEDDRHW